MSGGTPVHVVLGTGPLGLPGARRLAGEGRRVRAVNRSGRAELPRGVEHDVKMYPDAGHGFLNDHDPAELPIWVKVIAKLAAASYHEPSARDARCRSVAFFDTHLNP